MLSRFQNPEVYVQEGYMFHRRCSLLLRCGHPYVQLPEVHMSELLLPNQLQVLLRHPLMLRFSFRKCLL